MYKKKIIGIALIAALVGSMAATSVSARDFIPDDEVADYFSNHTIGVIGGFNSWASDVAKLTDEDGDGIYTAVVENVEPGTYEFKVRADEDWADSWGEYEADYDRTFNSQTNCSITVEETGNLVVELDTTGDDSVVWPVNYYMQTEEPVEEPTGTPSRYGIVGSMTGWGNDMADFEMYETEAGVYVGKTTELPAGSYQFKVRADSDWADSWGVYEEDYDRTYNSQTNLEVTLDEAAVITVKLDATGDDEIVWPVSYKIGDGEWVYTGPETAEEPTGTPSRYGIVGNMTGWGNDMADFAMYETEAGVYVGKTTELPAGDYQFKVRADSDWTDSWGVYEEDYDRTYNSQTNVEVTLDEAAVITVKLDATSGSDEDAVALWPVSYKIGDGEWVYTGPEATDPQESQVSQVSQESQVSQVSQVSQESQVSQVSQVSQGQPSQTSNHAVATGGGEENSEVKEPEYYETQVGDYIYFDNSETKWEKVCAYWWHKDFARTYDLENNDWGIVKTVNEETGVEGWEPVKFPGTEMTQIEGTDIWQARIPFGAQKIIFNSGKTDEQIWAGETGYQSDDLVFDEKANAGQVFKLDVSEAPKAGRGKEKTKLTYNAGEWKAYDGKFMSEQIGELPPVSEISTGDESQTSQTPSGNSQTPSGNSQTPSGNSQTPSGNSQTPSGNSQTSTTGTTTPVVNTGDATMPIAVGAVAVMALGAAVIASKKKEQE